VLVSILYGTVKNFLVTQVRNALMLLTAPYSVAFANSAIPPYLWWRDQDSNLEFACERLKWSY